MKHPAEALQDQLDRISDVLSKEALRVLVTHSWPGNVRELRNAVEHALVLARGGTVLPEHLPDTVRAALKDGPRNEDEQVRAELSGLSQPTLRALGCRHAETFQL